MLSNEEDNLILKPNTPNCEMPLHYAPPLNRKNLNSRSIKLINGGLSSTRQMKNPSQISHFYQLLNYSSSNFNTKNKLRKISKEIRIKDHSQSNIM